MEKRFQPLAKTLKFVELSIEGSYGEGLTLQDFQKYDTTAIKNVDKDMKKRGFIYWSVYVTIRKNGTFTDTKLNEAHRRFEDCYDSQFLLLFEKFEDYYKVKTIRKAQ